MNSHISWKAVIGIASLGITLTLLRGQEASIGMEREGNIIRLQVSGGQGHELVLESASELAPEHWSPLVVRQSDDSLLIWDEATTPGQRFYRGRDRGLFTLPDTVGNFRLTDHLDTSHELEYQHDEPAVVLVFVNDALLSDVGFAEELDELREHFGGEGHGDDHGGVVFWLVHASGAENRDTIASLVEVSGIDLPVLHDARQLLARDLGIKTFPEVVALDPETQAVFYRGALSGAEEHARYLEDALNQHMAEEAVTTRYVRAQGEPLTMTNAFDGLTYTEDAAPILIKHCVICHSLGNIAPFSIDGFATVEQWADQIKEEVMAERMPPWHADPRYGHFVNDASLTTEEAAILVDWVNQGAVRGEGDDPVATFIAENPPGQVFPSAWPAELGEPDYIIDVPEQSIPAHGEVDYRYLTIKADLPEDVWLSAAVVLPGNLAVVHHVLVFDGDSRKFLAGLSGYFAAYAPGTPANVYPPGTGRFLRKTQTMTFQMHYITTGKPEKDKTRLGLYVLDERPESELITKSAFSVAINIPPRAPDHELKASVAFDKDTMLYEVSPHMHYRGSRFRYEARYPDNTRKTLLSVPKYWFDWQSVYRFDEPVLLPKGTVIECVGAFDNSKHNHENPDPSKRVRFGEQTDDEMFIGYMNVVELP